MSTVSNFELFEELYNFILNPKHDLNDTLKEFGGSCFYVPSHKTTFRNQELIDAYKEGKSVKELSREYDLSEARVYAITKEIREPSLFGE